MISCYLLFAKMFKHSKDALLYYGLMRTDDGKGVTIPSQIRYVNYFDYYLKSGYRLNSLRNREYRIERILLGPFPDIKQSDISNSKRANPSDLLHHP